MHLVQNSSREEGVEVFFSSHLGVKGEVLGVDPEPEYDWGEQGFGGLFQVLYIFEVPVEGSDVLEQVTDLFVPLSLDSRQIVWLLNLRLE